MEQNQLNIQVFDHWSDDDTRQDAWFTASSLQTVIETMNPKPKWITIMSDNGMHYHCTELMLILGHWKEWYDVIPRKWSRGGQNCNRLPSCTGAFSYVIILEVKDNTD